jgi:ribosomal protein S18 acetylase RimI-like enzyme
VKIDADWVAEHRLTDGTPVQVRAIRASDAAELRRGYDRLSPRSRYLRFLAAAPQLTDEVVRYLTEVDGVDHVALVALRVSHDLKTEIGLGVARFFRLPETPEVAEVAVTVVDEMQGKGLGRLLTRLVAEAARERGIRAFRAEVAVENDAMRGLLAAAGATVVKEEAGTLIFDVPVGSPEGAAAQDTPLARLLALAATFVAALRAAVPDGAPSDPPEPSEPPAPADADSRGRSRPSGE